MINYLKITALILILGIVTMTHTYADTRVSYQAAIKINRMPCKITLNDMQVYNSLEASDTAPYNLQFGHGLTEYLLEGKNILKLRVENPYRYLSEKDLHNGYCGIKVNAKVFNPIDERWEEKLVTHIRATYELIEEKDGKKIYDIVTKYSTPLEDSPLTSEIIREIGIPLVDEKTGKVALEQFYLSRNINVNHKQPFSWVERGQVFVETPASRELLIQKYEEIQQAMIKKDLAALRTLTEPGVLDMAKFYRTDTEKHFKEMVEMTLDPIMYLPSNWRPVNIREIQDLYDIETYADGKLFRFNLKNAILASPLKWENTSSSEYLLYNPVFALIDGEIVMATF